MTRGVRLLLWSRGRARVGRDATTGATDTDRLEARPFPDEDVQALPCP